MVWNSTSPDGTKSVKANTTPMQQNTTYTETTLNVDHYWNIGTNEDGRHKQVQMPKTEAGGSPSDITLGTGMDLKEAASGTVQGYYRNSVNIYQFIPAFLTGTVVLNKSTYVTVDTLPNNTYGYVNVWIAGTSRDISFGFFKAEGGICNAFAYLTQFSGSSTNKFIVNFENYDGGGSLALKAKAEGGAASTYQYRITYWDI